ncbi:MAG: hypothetical protein ABIG91_03665 [Patescibacteria group bacterium]
MKKFWWFFVLVVFVLVVFLWGARLSLKPCHFLGQVDYWDFLDETVIDDPGKGWAVLIVHYLPAEAGEVRQHTPGSYEVAASGRHFGDLEHTIRFVLGEDQDISGWGVTVWSCPDESSAGHFAWKVAEQMDTAVEVIP